MSSTVCCIDLTARHGLYALQQLVASQASHCGSWLDIPLAEVATAPRVSWFRPQRLSDLASLPANAGVVTLLVGPGAATLLQQVLLLPTLQQAQTIWVFMTPSAIVEQTLVERALRTTLPQAQPYQLPNSDPQTLWFILMEQLDKLNFLTPSPQHPHSPGEDMTPNLKESMNAAMSIDGAVAAALVDYRSGMCLAQAGSGMNLELAAAGNTQVVQSKLKTMQALGLRQGMEDMLITLADQYHLIRMAPNHNGLFLYLVLNKAQGNLALARYKLTDIERALVI